MKSMQTWSRDSAVFQVRSRQEEKGQTGQSWQEGDSNANNSTLQKCSVEEHLWTHNASNLLSGWATAAEYT